MGEVDHYIERIQAAVHTVFQQMQPELLEVVHSYELTPTQFFVLIYVNKKGSCKVSQLAEHMDVKPSAVTLMIDRLEQHKLVEREHDKKDRRVVNIRLSERGEERLKQLIGARKAVAQRYLSSLTTEELEAMASITEKLAQITVFDKNEEEEGKC
ncbi:MarR family winged helix-turn-helix transcriptional regulator [Bacillus sp. OTU530]|uniref:MarR family winged helix-turn-helix transcriptional regulator n=1 Tax=Bacillus sp. OTU530 TaxID=3043862 RepID=UPI00313C3DCC